MGPAHCPCSLLLPDPDSQRHSHALGMACKGGEKWTGVCSKPISLPHATCGKTSGLSSGQGHSGTSGTPKHGALTQQATWQAPWDRPGASELVLKAQCPLNMGLLCGGQESGPVTKVWKRKPRSLGLNPNRVSVKLSPLSSASVSLLYNVNCRQALGFLPIIWPL